MNRDARDPGADDLRFQKSVLEAQSEASPDGILVVSPDGRVLSFNRRFVDMWTITEDVLARGEDDLALAAVRDQLVDPQTFVDRVSYLYAHPGETANETLRLKDGRTFERYSAPVYGPAGEITGRVWFFRDVTDRLAAEAARGALIREQAARENALQRSARLRSLHEAALTIAAPVSSEPDAVAVLLARITRLAVQALEGRDGRIVLAEHAAWHDLVPGTIPEEGLILLDHAGRLRRSEQRPHGVTAHVLAQGELMMVRDTLAPVGFGPYDGLAEAGIRSFVVAPLVAGEHILGALSVTFNHQRDFLVEDRESLQLFAAHAAAALERVRLESERRVALQDLAKHEAEAAALRQLDRLKSSLLLMISHELRTPLTLIHGYAELLQARAGTLPAEATRSMAGRIHAGSTQLARLVDGLLDFARIQHGDVLVQPETIDLVPVVEDVLGGLRSRPGGERLVLESPPAVRVNADRMRLAQVVTNLVENALAYAPDGPIVVRARPPEGGADLPGATFAARSMVRVEIQDQGPGLPLEEQPYVWDSFFRGSRVAGLNVAPGSGIGLAVVKALVEAHGGRVGLVSAPGAGACFWFELPGPREPATQESGVQEALLGGAGQENQGDGAPAVVEAPA
jgi:signal transduction histidine kinase